MVLLSASVVQASGKTLLPWEIVQLDYDHLPIFCSYSPASTWPAN